MCKGKAQHNIKKALGVTQYIFKTGVFLTTRRGRIKRTALNNIYQKELYQIFGKKSKQKQAEAEVVPSSSSVKLKFLKFS